MRVDTFEFDYDKKTQAIESTHYRVAVHLNRGPSSQKNAAEDPIAACSALVTAIDDASQSWFPITRHELVRYPKDVVVQWRYEPTISVDGFSLEVDHTFVVNDPMVSYLLDVRHQDDPERLAQLYEAMREGFTFNEDAMRGVEAFERLAPLETLARQR